MTTPSIHNFRHIIATRFPQTPKAALRNLTNKFNWLCAHQTELMHTTSSLEALSKIPNPINKMEMAYLIAPFKESIKLTKELMKDKAKSTEDFQLSIQKIIRSAHLHN